MKKINKNTSVILFIALRIIGICVIGMLMTYVPDQLREFFGDVKITNDGGFDSGWKWGRRHYWYSGMTICLFILSIIHLVGDIIEKTDS